MIDLNKLDEHRKIDIDIALMQSSKKSIIEIINYLRGKYNLDLKDAKRIIQTHPPFYKSAKNTQNAFVEALEFWRDDMNETAIITGVQGQDGSYLAEYLLKEGLTVIGVARRKSSGETNDNIRHILEHEAFKIVYGDITDSCFINDLVRKHHPDFYFNLAAMSHVGQSFKEPLKTFEVDATAVVLALDAIRRHSRETKFYQASTSELYGTTACPETGFTEGNQFYPRSPYGVAKLAAYHATVNYREAYGLFACNGILFNHSSIRRGADFATRKITKGVADIAKGKTTTLKMGNMEAFRDEGCASDYVQAMYLMLKQDTPDDYVVSTGQGATIKEMLEYVCSLAGLKYDEVYEMNPEFMRPSDVPYLLGDNTKIKKLGWEPEYNWRSLLKEMYENDVESA